MGVCIDVPREGLATLGANQCFPIGHNRAVGLRDDLDILHLVVGEANLGSAHSLQQFLLAVNPVLVNCYQIVGQEVRKCSPVIASQGIQDFVLFR